MSSITSTYEVDDALSRHGSKMIIWKAGDVIYSDLILWVVITLHALHGNVLKEFSAWLEWLGHYALRLVHNRVFYINNLVLVFMLNSRHAIPKLSNTAMRILMSILAACLHLGC